MRARKQPTSLSINGSDELSALLLNDIRHANTLKSIKSGLRQLYESFDSRLEAGDFEVCDHALSRLNTIPLKPELLVGVLTITLRAKAHLPSRAEFARVVRQQFDLSYGPPRADAILRGLD